MKTKIIELFLILLLFLVAISKAQQIEIIECSSSRDPWICYTKELCICKIYGICTDGILIIYKDNVRDALCYPSIEKGIAAIYLDECNDPRGEIKVRASCLEGNSAEKIIKIEEKIERATTTTTIATRETTTIKECSKLGDSCAYQSCCEGLYCCSDMICKESCEEERSETNFWLIIIPIVGLLIIVASFVIIKRKKVKM